MIEENADGVGLQALQSLPGRLSARQEVEEAKENS